MSERIVKILAIDASDKKMYILDRSNSFLRYSSSEWTFISPEQWGRVKASSRVILATHVPDNLLRKNEIGGEIVRSNDGHQWTGILSISAVYQVDRTLSIDPRNFYNFPFFGEIHSFVLALAIKTDLCTVSIQELIYFRLSK